MWYKPFPDWHVYKSVGYDHPLVFPVTSPVHFRLWRTRIMTATRATARWTRAPRQVLTLTISSTCHCGVWPRRRWTSSSNSETRRYVPTDNTTCDGTTAQVFELQYKETTWKLNHLPHVTSVIFSNLACVSVFPCCALPLWSCKWVWIHTCEIIFGIVRFFWASCIICHTSFDF